MPQKLNLTMTSCRQTWTPPRFGEELHSFDSNEPENPKTTPDRLLPARTFRVPDLTESDEEEIRLDENSNAQPGKACIADSERLLETPPTKGDSASLSQLGDSTHLFPPHISIEKFSPSWLQTDANFHIFGGFGHTSGKLFKFDPQETSSSNSKRRLDRRQGVSKDFRAKSREMVTERQAPKPATDLSHANVQPTPDHNYQPEFGKVSALNNHLQSSIFNIPKPYHARPEHHRQIPGGTSTATLTKLAGSKFKNPFEPQQPLQPEKSRHSSATEGFVEIPRPTNPPSQTTQHFVQPTFSASTTNANWIPPNNMDNHIGNFIDLTSGLGRYHPDAALFDARFGSADPYTYVDTVKATENIKALLEGAFEDEEDKPQKRGQRKKIEVEVSGVADKLQGLKVQDKPNQADAGKEEEGENEDEEGADDGSVEGLKVKLLPHQIEGVEWMKDKESGRAKKNGVRPKGGILADDVRPLKNFSWHS